MTASPIRLDVEDKRFKKRLTSEFLTHSLQLQHFYAAEICVSARHQLVFPFAVAAARPLEIQHWS